MTVAELIEKLQKGPPDAEVFVRDFEGEFGNVRKLFLYRNTPKAIVTIDAGKE
jgi:hypothetical protein